MYEFEYIVRTDENPCGSCQPFSNIIDIIVIDNMLSPVTCSRISGYL